MMTGPARTVFEGEWRSAALTRARYGTQRGECADGRKRSRGLSEAEPGFFEDYADVVAADLRAASARRACDSDRRAADPRASRQECTSSRQKLRELIRLRHRERCDRRKAAPLHARAVRRTRSRNDAGRAVAQPQGRFRRAAGGDAPVVGRAARRAAARVRRDADGVREYADRLRAPYCGPEAAASSRTMVRRRKRVAIVRVPAAAHRTRRSACSRSRATTHTASTPAWAPSTCCGSPSSRASRSHASCPGRSRPMATTAPRAPAATLPASTRRCSTRSHMHLATRAAAHAQRLSARRRAVARAGGRRRRSRELDARAADALPRDAAWPRAVRPQPCADAFGVARVLPLPDRARSLAQATIRAPGIKAPKSPRRLPSALSPEEAAQLVTIGGDDPLVAARSRAVRARLFVGTAAVGARAARRRAAAISRPAKCACSARAARSASCRWARRRATRSRAGWPCARRTRGAAETRDVHRAPRTAPVAARDPAAARRMGDPAGTVAARASAHAAPFVRIARAAVVGRPARRAGDAGTRIDRQHAGLHAPRFPGARQGVRRRASARAAQATK